MIFWESEQKEKRLLLMDKYIGTSKVAKSGLLLWD